MTWYNAGTVTATNNSATVTGSGTAFLANIRVGDAITIAGSTTLHEVTNVTSDTQLTIAPVYPGTTGGSKVYAAVPVQGYVRDLADQTKSLILSFGSIGANANVAALMGLTGTNLNVPMFTGAGTMALRSLVTSNTDTTAGRILTVGAFGIGSTSLSATNVFTGNIDTSAPAGWCYTSSPSGTMPSGASNFGYLTTLYGNATYVLQDYVESVSAYRQWQRVRDNGTWTAWRLKYKQSNVVGTASQSGGVPTGAIIESGSNANGNYIRYADGTQICHQTINIATWGAGGSNSATWTFPVAFTVSPVIQGTIASTSPHLFNASVAPVGTTTCTVVAGGSVSAAGAVYVTAHGRWY